MTIDTSHECNNDTVNTCITSVESLEVDSVTSQDPSQDAAIEPSSVVTVEKSFSSDDVSSGAVKTSSWLNMIQEFVQIMLICLLTLLTLCVKGTTLLITSIGKININEWPKQERVFRYAFILSCLVFLFWFASAYFEVKQLFQPDYNLVIDNKFYPSQIVTKGQFPTILAKNQPALKVSEPIWSNNVRESLQHFIFDFKVDIVDRDTVLKYYLTNIEILFMNNGPCFLTHTVKRSLHVSKTMVYADPIKVELPFHSENPMCHSFKEFPSKLKFRIDIYDDTISRNGISYFYEMPLWANHFMGTFSSDLALLGWEPIRMTMMGVSGWGKSTFINELGEFTSIYPSMNRIKLVSDAGAQRKKDHSTLAVHRYSLWESGKFADIPLCLEVQDPPGHDTGAIDKVPQYVEYLAKQKITLGDDIVSECSVNPYTCLNKYKNRREELADVIIYMIPCNQIEKHKDNIESNLNLFHHLQIPVIIVFTMGVETNRTVLQEEIEKLDGFGYHTYVISGEHHQNNSPKNPEVIRRIAQILLEVFHIVKSRRRGIAHLTWMFKTWKVLGQVIHQYGWYFWTWVVANLGLVFLFFSKKRNEGLQSDRPSVQDESK